MFFCTCADDKRANANDGRKNRKDDECSKQHGDAPFFFFYSIARNAVIYSQNLASLSQNHFTKDINRRCHQIGRTLMALTSVGVFHSPEVHKDNPIFDAYRQPISDSKVLDDKDLPFRCSVGEFVDSEGNRYLLINNRDYIEKREFKLKLKDKFRVYEVSQEDGLQSVRHNRTQSLSVTLQAGDAILLRFQDANEKAFLIDYVLQK